MGTPFRDDEQVTCDFSNVGHQGHRKRFKNMEACVLGVCKRRKLYAARGNFTNNVLNSGGM